MRTMKKQNKNKKEIKKTKFDWVLYFAIIGWTGIFAIWLWQAIKLFIATDTNRGILYLVIGIVFLFIGIKSTRDHIKRKKTEPKKNEINN